MISQSTHRKTEFYNLLYCFDHKTKSLEYFCKFCENPICAECILESHNGHAIQKLSEVHKEIKEDLKRKKKYRKVFFRNIESCWQKKMKNA